MLEKFHVGDTEIELKKMGREDDEIWYEQTNLPVYRYYFWNGRMVGVSI